jgi:hypothetical protein
MAHVTLNPEQAYLAVFSFLDDSWERLGRQDELAMFLDMAKYAAGHGTADPAMWSDWLAAIHAVQTGVMLPDEEHESLAPNQMKPMDPEQAYLAMFRYIEDYWNRVMQPAEIGDLLGRMRYTPGEGTADPAMWQHWLDAIEKTRAPPARGA